jgi:hypothetical protein
MSPNKQYTEVFMKKLVLSFVALSAIGFSAIAAEQSQPQEDQSVNAVYEVFNPESGCGVGLKPVTRYCWNWGSSGWYACGTTCVPKVPGSMPGSGGGGHH